MATRGFRRTSSEDFLFPRGKGGGSGSLGGVSLSSLLGTSPFESEEPLSDEMEQLLNSLKNLDVGRTAEETKGLSELEETALVVVYCRFRVLESPQ